MQRSDDPRPIYMNRPATDDVELIICSLPSGERYVIVYSDDDRQAALAQLGVWAADHELGFTWMDAARCAVEIRKRAGEKVSRRV